ncbi:UBP-type zinc finger domain-containing protein [Zobellia nedashkovskayae]|uniref:UBP-type zinc finger domain-containing protein n=1 Tax=Zobellia nedashkovskayae TaxID=2779510 RepID=UPI00188D1217|nr:UBP-type zinc finger domain-containing protein [Zobellia nedashkovskayae]
MSKITRNCDHLDAVAEVKEAKTHKCSECVKTGDNWLHLRTCQTCGVTLCCDSSPNQHASKHAKLSGHPVISSAEPGERWLWCYEDEQIANY